MTPMADVINALIARDSHGPADNKYKAPSSHSPLNDVIISSALTIGTNFFSISCLEKSHNNVVVVKCWTKRIFDSRHFWMYIQENSEPRAKNANV